MYIEIYTNGFGLLHINGQGSYSDGNIHGPP